MKTMDFFAWLKINYPDADKYDFLCENCSGEIEYDCLSCGQHLFDDELEKIYDEYKSQKLKDEKLFNSFS